MERLRGGRCDNCGQWLADWADPDVRKPNRAYTVVLPTYVVQLIGCEADLRSQAIQAASEQDAAREP